MKDFKDMELKLLLQICGAILSAAISNGKARASGYNHSYMDHCDINLAALSAYPSDEEITCVVKQAYDKAENLFVLLRIVTSDLHSPSHQLPNI